VLEDVCQFAWTQLIAQRERVEPRAVASWLARTATREAVRWIHRSETVLSLDAEVEARGDRLTTAAEDEPFDRARRRELLACVRELPLRQQRAVWLRAFGFSRPEAALHELCTPRTVERQLTRADARLRELLAEG